MRSLVSDMTHEDPSKRPKIDEVVRRFTELRASLPAEKLRSRVVDSWTLYPAFAGIRFRLRRLKLTWKGAAPIPDPFS